MGWINDGQTRLAKFTLANAIKRVAADSDVESRIKAIKKIVNKKHPDLADLAIEKLQEAIRSEKHMAVVNCNLALKGIFQGHPHQDIRIKALKLMLRNQVTELPTIVSIAVRNAYNDKGHITDIPLIIAAINEHYNQSSDKAVKDERGISNALEHIIAVEELVAATCGMTNEGQGIAEAAIENALPLYQAIISKPVEEQKEGDHSLVLAVKMGNGGVEITGVDHSDVIVVTAAKALNTIHEMQIAQSTIRRAVLGIDNSEMYQLLGQWLHEDEDLDTDTIDALLDSDASPQHIVRVVDDNGRALAYILDKLKSAKPTNESIILKSELERGDVGAAAAMHALIDTYVNDFNDTSRQNLATGFKIAALNLAQRMVNPISDMRFIKEAVISVASEIRESGLEKSNDLVHSRSSKVGRELSGRHKTQQAALERLKTSGILGDEDVDEILVTFQNKVADVGAHKSNMFAELKNEIKGARLREAIGSHHVAAKSVFADLRAKAGQPGPKPA